LGVRAAQGTFKINLIFGESSERLNMIKPTLLSKLINSIFGNYDPWWKGFFLPKDKWWKISPFQGEMDLILSKTVKELKAYGLPWLERNSAT
jgi:putative methionine-R-sulfoxide reductase with GAF domain